MARRAAAFCALLLLAAGCGGSDESDEGSRALGNPPSWPAPPNAMALTRKAGLVPERAEFLEYHVHAHLDVFFNGQTVAVPAGIGIDTSNSAVVSDTGGVGLKNVCKTPCISPLHTHATDGVLHTETKTPMPNTLGQFFTEWNVNLAPGRVGAYENVKIYVDGKEFDGDPRTIELSDMREIAVVIGTPPASIPSEFPQ